MNAPPVAVFCETNVTVDLSCEEERIIKQYRQLSDADKKLIGIILDELTERRT